MTRSRRSTPTKIKAFLQLAASYCLLHRTLLLRTALFGVGAGVIIAFSLPQTYTVEITAVPKVTWTRSSISRQDNLLSLLSGNLVNNNPDDPDCFRPSLYPHIVASTPFLLRLAEIPVHTLDDTTTCTLGHYVDHVQRTPWWNYVLGAPKLATGFVRNLLTADDPNPADTPDTAGKPTATPPAIRRLSKQQLRTAGRIFRCLHTETDEDKFTVSFRATLQDPMVAALVADSFRVHMQTYIQHYRDVKARRHLAYCDTLLQQARTDYFKMQETLAAYEDSHRQLNGFQNRQEGSRLRLQKNRAYQAYLQAETNYREAQNRITAVTPLYSVITPAEVPQHPDGPGRWVIVLLTTLLAVGCVPLGNYLKPRIGRLRYWKCKRRRPAGGLQPLPNRPTA